MGATVVTFGQDVKGDPRFGHFLRSILVGMAQDGQLLVLLLDVVRCRCLRIPFDQQNVKGIQVEERGSFPRQPLDLLTGRQAGILQFHCPDFLQELEDLLILL